MQKLSNISFFVDERIAVADLDLNDYISTENILPNKAGITRSTGLPAIQQTKAYKTDDVLVSNIRPYFRKIWLADRDGGCSNDVLVLRAKEDCLPSFLYYVLSNDEFFDYATATARGTKMPRGDKDAIMRFMVPELPIDAQREVVAILSALDAKINNNQKINHHLSLKSVMDNSPDIKQGRRVSRRVARRVEALSFSRMYAINGSSIV